MGKRILMPAQEINLDNVQYVQERIEAPHLTGFLLKLFVWLVESRLFGHAILSVLKRKNKMTQILRHTVIPEEPMFFPEFPPQEPETAVDFVDEDTLPALRVDHALKCLPSYDTSKASRVARNNSFLYWTIRDYANAYQSGHTTPSDVAECIISAVEESLNRNPPLIFFISFNANELRKQAAASTRRFEEGSPLSILDGIFIAIKDDIDCYPYPSKGGTVWFHKAREVKQDAVCVSRLRSCGAILAGKANMHELGMGVTGNNPHYGTTRNPHMIQHYTGGSSSGPAAIVASGLCAAALGTDGGGSVRIPSALCGVTGFKTTYGRTDITGSICEGGTVEIIGPIATTVEDVMLVYAAILGLSTVDLARLRPMPPCFPMLGTTDNLNLLGSLKLGKYSSWFTDVYSNEVSETCERILTQVANSFGTETREIILPELDEMRAAHLVSIGSEALNHIYPHFENGQRMALSYDIRLNMALFESFLAADYVVAQSLRRRIMHYHMEAFKHVDVIVTPTTGMTAPKIPSSSLKIGESDFETAGHLMRFVLAPNLIGLPAISIPVGHDKDGLPIGLQLIGRPWAEATLLRLASAIEEIAPPQKRPAIFYDVFKVAWSIGPSFILWHVWLERNRRIFHDMQLVIRQLWGKIVNSLQETLLAKCDIDGGLDPIDTGIFSRLSFPLRGCTPLVPHTRSGNNTKHHSKRVNRQGHWSPPEAGTLKINTDGSSRGNPGPGGIGGVGRDSSGDIQFLFSIYKGNQTNNYMEALAILVAVEQCCQRGWNRIICESDSQVVVNLLHSRSLVHVDWHLALVIHQIIQLSNSLDSVSFKHIPREWNGVADCLAKWASEQGPDWNVLEQRMLPLDLSQMLVQLVDHDKAM